MAFTSSELTMLNILLQKTPDAVGSSMVSIKTGVLKTTVKRVNKCFAAVFQLHCNMSSLMLLLDKELVNWRDCIQLFVNIFSQEMMTKSRHTNLQ